MIRKITLRLLLSLLVVSSLSTPATAENPVWTFTPLTSTTVTPPATVQYRVTNQSSKPHTLVLSPVDGVTQVTTAGNCSDSFTLTPANPSCTLTLDVAGSASNTSLGGEPTVCQQDVNGHASPFQCYRPSRSDTLKIVKQTRQQMAYIPSAGNSTLSICPVGTDGNLGECIVSDGNQTFAAPLAASVNPKGTFIYLLNSANATVSICPINENGLLGTCTVSSGNGTFFHSNTISINPEATYVYISNAGAGSLSICPLNPDGSFGICLAYNNSQNAGSTFNTIGSLIYTIVVNGDVRDVWYCSLNSDGSLATPCPLSASATFDGSYGVSLRADGQFIYIANTGTSNISICPIDQDGSLEACVVNNAGGTLSFSPGGRTALFMTSSTGYGYIPNLGNNTVSICSILSDGSLNACRAVNGNNTFNQPGSVSLFPV